MFNVKPAEFNMLLWKHILLCVFFPMFYGDHTVKRTVPFFWGLEKLQTSEDPQGPLKGLTDRFAIICGSKAFARLPPRYHRNGNEILYEELLYIDVPIKDDVPIFV